MNSGAAPLLFVPAGRQGETAGAAQRRICGCVSAGWPLQLGNQNPPYSCKRVDANLAGPCQK
ncbi:hypothetical protein RA21_14265 [Leisingera sp. ANG-DT]|nr:hypothetical protein RA21_14265 [Leisingera sp. ANG-DT]